jgi:hypothetical protein
MSRKLGHEREKSFFSWPAQQFGWSSANDLVRGYQMLLRNQVVRNVTNEGMTPRVLDIGLPATTQKQDGYSKPKKPMTN